MTAFWALLSIHFCGELLCCTVREILTYCMYVGRYAPVSVCGAPRTSSAHSVFIKVPFFILRFANTVILYRYFVPLGPCINLKNDEF